MNPPPPWTPIHFPAPSSAWGTAHICFSSQNCFGWRWLPCTEKPEIILLPCVTLRGGHWQDDMGVKKPHPLFSWRFSSGCDLFSRCLWDKAASFLALSPSLLTLLLLKQLLQEMRCTQIHVLTSASRKVHLSQFSCCLLLVLGIYNECHGLYSSF